MKKSIILAGMMALSMSACNNQTTGPKLTQSGLDPQKFETTIDGKQTHLYTLTNKQGMEVCITNFGGRIVSVNLNDKNGTPRDVVLAFDNIADYQNNASDFGASIGRYANRIAGAKFVLDETTYELLANDGDNCLHGGPKGWQYKVFDGKQLSDNQVQLSLDSPDGDMNFPGNVKVKVTFTLTEDNAIDIQYSATTDKKTVINMTNHSYFNLSGDPTKDNSDHVLFVNADNYTPVNAKLIPLGTIESVKGTPMDFTTPKPIGQDINKTDFEQIKLGNGFDHNWVLNTNGDISKLAAKATCPSTGISVSVYTNEPGIQVYAGNFLNGSVKGKHGIAYNKRTAVCLETQHYPDSPNQPSFPSVVLEPGQTYNSECIFKFSVE
ncbi:MAG: galactose mutarotase [Bacteroidaceae bacterium]|jgi:aldose 1-epimerase|nr:galactose mutarotase [Bacteroidaceae bacterium]